MITNTLDRGCGGPCDHTDEEHAAFDAGVLSGESGYDWSAVPYSISARHSGLREAWLSGHSVGQLNRSRVPERIQCLSLWQPWASLCVIGSKRIETRRWSTDYRGPLVIHAAVRLNKRDMTYFSARWDMCAALAPVGKRMGDQKPLWEILPFGALLGVVDLVDCRPVESFTGAELDTRRYPQGEDHRGFYVERSLGNYEPGRYGWVLENPRPLPAPVPYRGLQGLFKVPTDLLKVPL